MEEIINILTEFTNVDKKEITKESGLLTDLELSSLDLINIVVRFEDEYNIEIPDSELKNLQTVADIAAFLEKNV